MSIFHLPADKTRRQQWLDALNLTVDNVNEYTHICSRDFLHGDPSNTPALDLGKRFASPKKMDVERSRRVPALDLSKRCASPKKKDVE